MSVFSNCYTDPARAEAYSKLDFGGTYSLAFRDLPALFQEHVRGTHAVDFGCGTGRSTRFLRQCGFETTGIDVSEQMIAKAREIDPAGDYRLMADGDFSLLEPNSADLVLCAFPFDNIAGEKKTTLLRGLRGLLKPEGRLLNIVSSREIYLHEWATFSTRDFPENESAKSGDVVRIITKDYEDSRPVEDILWTDESYLEVYEAAGLRPIASHRPLARGDEPYAWISETTIAPWVIWVCKRSF